jgi:hypothetical protein
MKKEELNRLLEKYYNGGSTVEEEEALRSFFTEVDTMEGYEAEKAIFGYLSDPINIPEPSDDFEVRILRGIDESEQKSRLTGKRNYIRFILSTAAGLLILAGSYFFFSGRDEFQDTFTDPEIAYAETIKILMDVSSQLNRGARVLEPVGKINEVKTKKIEDNLKSLKYIQTAIDLTNVSDENK